MAFQMIPPRVSSSPPPLDTLPSVVCPGDDDEDEEFGTFATHSTFDITGLSDKLPPTPERNPTTCLGEKNVALSLKESDGTIGTVIAGGLPQPPVCDNSVTVHVEDINGEVSSSLEINEDGDDFGDFSFFTSNAAGGKIELEGADDNASEKVKTGDIDSSQNCNLEPKVVDSSPNHSVSSFSMIATPPPLDHVVDNIVVDDEFSRISPNSPPVEDEDDDFGDFTACTFDNSKDSSFPVVGTVKEYVTPCQNSLEDCRPQIPDISEHKPDSTCGVGLPSTESPVVSHKTSREEICESRTQCESDPQNSCEVKSVDSYSEITDRTRNPEDCNDDDSDSKECQLNKDKEIAPCNEGSHSDSEKDPSLHNLASSGPLTDRGTSLELSHSGEVENKFNKGLFGLGNEDCLAQNLSITDNGDNDSHELESENVSKAKPDEVSASPPNSEKDNVRTEYREGKIVNKETDSVKSSLTLSKDDNGDEFECDWSSSDFKKAEEEDDDDDDLDFGDLREQVRSGKFGMNESSETDDDFGEFYDGTKMAPQVLNEEEDQEFGEFGTAVAEDENADKFGDFAQVESDDGFANFASQESQILDKKVTNESALEEEDEFGDFTSQQNVENQSDFKMPWLEHATSTSTKDSAVLKKLESLILKWIPREPVTSTFENQENQIVPTLFQSIEDDAFVWRQLENLEASAALTLSWGNTQAQTLYLSSVNVDARNILFGQKWSSSVPLFAQTLSFSPLTPAKPTENGSTLEGGNRGSVSPPILSSGITPKFSASFRKDENEVEITSDDENAPEEQIPPAKFDWTSSGLTNPLEGPAYNSSLFDMDLLLSNSDIGKGATNALLASLEREFLSEGGEKSSISRIKGPPTPSPLVQQILGSGKNSTQLAATPLQSLSTEIREVVENLPNIGFMRSRVLMFPIRGDH